jgi:hypothetical protein
VRDAMPSLGSDNEPRRAGTDQIRSESAATAKGGGDSRSGFATKVIAWPVPQIAAVFRNLAEQRTHRAAPEPVITCNLE